MQKDLISIPDKFNTLLIETKIERPEKALYECALAVEKDSALHQEMLDWNITSKDGLSEF